MSRPPRGWRAACLMLALLAPPVFAATAYLQPDAIFVGDIAELVIEHDSHIASLYALDTAPLAADFEVLDIKSRVFRLDRQAAGRHRMQWRLQLLPRRSGSLVVPAIRFGEHSTPPLELEVKAVADDARASQQVFVELESTPPAPYVGQQTRLSLRLLHNTPLRVDGLAEPRLSAVTSYRDLEERVYFVNRDGSEFRVLERQMLIFPRQAGELELPPAVLRGQLRRQDTTFVDGDPGQRKISRSSEPLHLQVREPPPAFGGRYWLPARDLVISQRLQPHGAELRIGDSIDWMLSLEARGLPAAALPANLLELEAPNFSIYADQPRRSDRLDNGDLVGRLEQRFAVIVTAAGEIELPAVDLAWWDLDTDREQLARLASTRIGVASGAATNDAPPSVDSDELLLAVGSERRWLWPLAGLAGVLMLLLFARACGRRARQLIERQLRCRGISRQLKQACRDHQADRARALLIEWGRARWPGEAVNGLYQIRDICRSTRLAAELSRLDAALFSGAETRWQGDGLWAALAAARRAVADEKRARVFAGLYPD